MEKLVEYKVSYGLGGGFGGATNEVILEFRSEKDAMESARELAIEEYQSYEGLHGIMGWDECRQEYIDEYGEEPDDEIIQDMYNEELETWLAYEVEVWDGEELE